MSVDTQLRVRELTELVRCGEYEVDPAAVAEAMLSRMVWDDVPDLTADAAPAERPRRPPRLRGLIRVRRLVARPIPPGAPLRA